MQALALGLGWRVRESQYRDLRERAALARENEGYAQDGRVTSALARKMAPTIKQTHAVSKAHTGRAHRLHSQLVERPKPERRGGGCAVARSNRKAHGLIMRQEISLASRICAREKKTSQLFGAFKRPTRKLATVCSPDALDCVCVPTRLRLHLRESVRGNPLIQPSIKVGVVHVVLVRAVRKCPPLDHLRNAGWRGW
eukprot:203976-Pleurochrysis_carterae.AAC.2